MRAKSLLCAARRGDIGRTIRAEGRLFERKTDYSSGRQTIRTEDGTTRQTATMPMPIDLVIGFLGGLALGFAGLRSNFCVMGAISDIVLMRDWRRFRAWLLAIATALAGTEALFAAGAVELDAAAYSAPEFGWLAALVGGLCFGFGMTLAGGCGLRALVRLGAGSVKSLVVILAIAAFAYLATDGAGAPVRDWLTAAANPMAAMAMPDALGSQDVSAVLAEATGFSRGALRATLALGGSGILLILCFKDAKFRASRRDIAGGAILGLIVVLGWLASGSQMGEIEGHPDSLNFVSPLGDFLALALGKAPIAGFAHGAVPGVILGAFAAVAWPWRLRVELSAGGEDFVHHALGGALMGLGGALALGCTIGQGVTGVSTLALGSLVVWSGIVAGAILALRYLEARANA